MESTRIESLLETGWHLIGQLNQWLCAPPQDMTDRERLFEIIRRLQLFWSKADDLNLRRMARNSLVLELFLERFCADTLQLTPLNRNDLTCAVNSLGSLLQGFESRSVEPDHPDLEVLQRLECEALQSSWADALQTRTIEISTAVIDEVVATPPLKSPNFARLPGGPNHVRFHTATTDGELRQEVNSKGKKARLTELPRQEDVEACALPAPPVPIRLSHQGHFARLSSLPMAEDAKPFPHSSARADAFQSRKVLMVEASLFYRHLFSDVLRTAGYEPLAIEGAEGQLEAIETDTAARFCAIMIGLPATAEATRATQRLRLRLGVHLVGLLTTEDHEFSTVEVDACVLKSHPRRLLDLLERLHRPSPEVALLTA